MRLGWRSNPYLVYRYYLNMRIIKLIHPKYGLCAQQVVYDGVQNIKNKWRYKYGKKYFECKIIVESDIPKFKERRIVNLETRDIYHTVEEASKELGISKETVNKHLNKKLKPENAHLYKVKWE